jgi:hypothetical protein|tara:strand:- start:387 stop:917 length:531 start_codon:yes stop_codon:yes gene_type:complete
MNKFENIITRFNKRIANPNKYDTTYDGYGGYLDEMGVKYVSSKEMCTPHHPDIASDLGYDAFVPFRDMWDRGGALASVFDHLRADLGKPIVVRNWWRPADYNEKVGGAPGSDHVGAYAIDMDFKTHDDRRHVERVLEGLYKDPELDMSLGLGGYTIHMGLCSERGNRRWYYDSYVK